MNIDDARKQIAWAEAATKVAAECLGRVLAMLADTAANKPDKPAEHAVSPKGGGHCEH